MNWIHPFLDGNGRTARALCYLVLNLKFGFILPGSPTIIEQLKEHREEYFRALTVADLSFNSKSRCELTPLKRLLERLLLRQLRNFPALSDDSEVEIAGIFDRRIQQLDENTRERFFGSVDVDYRTWSAADHLILHVGSPKTLEDAEKLLEISGQIFPGLLAAPGESAQLEISARQRGAIVRPRTFKISMGGAVWLEVNASVVIERPAIKNVGKAAGNLDWALDGALYILRRGDEISDLWAFDMLDVLIARHIHEAP